MNIGDLIYADNVMHYIGTETVSFHSMTEAQEFIKAFAEKMRSVWPEVCSDAEATKATMGEVQELRERCVMAVLRQTCTSYEINAEATIKAADSLAQYILNGAEKE